MTIRFDGQVAIVTGAGGALGRAYSRLLGERGATLLVNDLGVGLDGRGADADPARRLAVELRDAGVEAEASGHDVTDPDQVRAMVEQAVARWGRVDILINNAGTLRDRSFARMTDEDFRAVVEVHLFGTFHCTKAVWPHMQARGYGRVMLTTSHAALHGNFGQANYAAAKMAVLGLMGALKSEGPRSGILVNAVAPVAASRMAAGSELARIADQLDPDLVAAGVAYLVSPDCRDSGTVLAAGGGWFGRAAVLETAGLHPPAAVTPELVAECWREIIDLNNAVAYADAVDRLGALFPELRRPEEVM